MTDLDDSYRLCRQLARRHGKTYFWATRLLPRERRPHVHALYGFCRHADDIVDDLGPASLDARRSALTNFGERFFADLSTGRSDDPVLAAVVHTARSYDIDRDCFVRFLRSMEMDLSVESYPTFADLMVYMDGSAAVIGEMMLPVLYGPPASDPSSRNEPTPSVVTPSVVPPSVVPAARDLGVAFQLTNFLRDVAEDLDRGRVYLPQDDLERFGATGALHRRQVTPQWQALMADQIDRARCFYRRAEVGIGLLPPVSARCIAGARTLYSGILTRIEAAGYDVFSGRARVPTWRKVAVAARAVRP